MIQELPLRLLSSFLDREEAGEHAVQRLASRSGSFQRKGEVL